MFSGYNALAGIVLPVVKRDCFFPHDKGGRPPCEVSPYVCQIALTRANKMGQSEKEFEPRYLTSESVTEGHPDKLADQIADAILDEALRQDPFSRVAVEVLLTGCNVVIGGEITTSAELNMERIAREVIREVGYTDRELEFDFESCKICIWTQQQWMEIAIKVGKHTEGHPEKLGAGDQGIMYGYATDETKERIPLPILLANRITKRLAEVRKRGILPYLRPDGKSQVTAEYRNGIPDRVHTVLVSAQHDRKIKLRRLRDDIIQNVIKKVIPKGLLDKKTKMLVNKKGSFERGGPPSDTGLTGRKVMVDTYGGVGSHGGGSFSGKDPTKVDRSASYAARWVAKNIVDSGLARRAEVQLAYAIGSLKPIAVDINTYGTGKFSDVGMENVVSDVFDLRPGMIIKHLNLRRPIYRQVAVYGHFGRSDLDLPWERPNKVEQIKRSARSRGLVFR